MDTPPEYTYLQAIQNARDRYKQDGNEKAYLAAKFYLSLLRVADAYGNPKAKMALALGQHVIKGAVETLVGRFFDPHHQEAVRENFAQEVMRHATHEFSQDMEPVTAYLAHHLGLWPKR